jgi:hypothetical protein
MAGYIDKAPDTNFVDLVEDDDFKRDLVRFFSGGRYKYTKDQMREIGFEGLTKEFVEHMRAQSWNEVTAVKDLNYVKNKDFSQKGKDAFGRLIQAWDNSEQVGSTWGDAIGDFSEAIITAPSTWFGLGSFGITKLGAKAGSKATQLLVRTGLKEATQKNVAKTGAKRSVLNEAKKEAAIGFGTGITVGGVQAGAEGETREEVIEDFEYTGKDLLYDSLIGGITEGTIGGAGGYLSGVLGRGRQNKIDDILKERGKVFTEEAEKAAQRSLGTISGASPAQKKAAQTIIADLDDILSARAGVKGAKLKGRLDPERVRKGQAILAAMTDPKANPEFSSGLSAHTLRGIAAASVDLMNEFKLDTQGGEIRITEAIANAMQGEGSERVFNILNTVKNKYGLTKEEFSLIYMAEVSRAGQTLGFQSAIKRGGELRRTATPIDVLFAKGASSISGVDAKEISAAAIRNETTGAIYGFFQDLDTLRVSLMTSQPATTARNVMSTGILMGADMSDQVFKAIFQGMKGDTTGIKNIIPNTSAILRGMTMNKTEAQLLRQIMLDEMPEESKRLYSEAMRLEIGMESNSILAKVGRAANFANTLTDTALKEAIFYGALDRQFRDQGLSMTDWLRSNTKLDELPDGISLDAATKEANSMTMQDTFRDADSLVGTTTRSLVRLNRKVPFLVSTLAGVPFPRYLGNHIQKMSEYAPLFGEALHRAKITQGPGDTPSLRSILDPTTWDATRSARQATGAMMLWGGYELANQRQGEVDYGSVKNTLIQEIGDDADLKPLLGATMLHMYVGDQIWRKQNNLPASYEDAEQFRKDMADVLGGIPEFSFDLGLATGPVYAAFFEEDGASVEKFRRQIGDFIATYTMPGAIARDVIGQASYDQAGAPYTRDLAEGTDVSLIGAGEPSEEMKNRALRFAPDLLFLQYTQSFNGETDLSYYDFDNPVARGKIDPGLKQITGITGEPPTTALQREMSKYNLKNYQLYTNTTAKTANVDLVLRHRLAKTMYKDFEEWKKNAPASTRYGEMTYNEISEDPSIDNADKKAILEGWIKGRISAEKEQVETMFESFVAENPIKARGFIRNNYTVYARSKDGRRNLDTAAQMINGSSAEEYLAGSETVQDEIERRMKLLATVPNIAPLN